MSAKSEALRLAEWLEGDGGGLTTLGDCAAELRRLAEVEGQRDALLEALGKMVAVYSGQVQNDGGYTVLDSVRPLITDQAAIKAVEEGK